MHMRKSTEQCLLKDFITEVHTWLRGQKKGGYKKRTASIDRLIMGFYNKNLQFSYT